MTARLFVIYLVVVMALVFALVLRYLPRDRVAASAVLALWLAYVGSLSALGLVGNPEARPPGISLIAFPVIVFAIYLAFSRTGARIAAAFPIWVLLALQAFRIGVELLLHRLGSDGLVPRLMTYEGGNIDIYVGATAAVAAWLSTRGEGGRKAALAWNFIGLLALSNIVIRAVGTSPGPLHVLRSEVVDAAIGQFPYTYLAGAFVPLALIMHVLSIRQIWRPSL